MADSEKLAALKKAYAEIILNTAKEAAARIMVSERRAARYQQELFSAKDEALRMLLRLKQMLDAKVNEAEMMSLNQQKRIEELEAQLGEAEDIVRDLRGELREAQDELENMKKERMHCLGKQKSKNDVSTSVEVSQENRIYNSGSTIFPLPESENAFMTVSDIKSSVLDGTYVGNTCSCTENCYVCNPDFASIVMRHKEPDLYRNGCTQRIRAIERCLLNENLSLSQQADDAKNEKPRECAEGKELHTKLSLRADISREGKTDELKVMQSDSCNIIQVLPLTSFHRKRKRAARYKKSSVPSSMNVPDQVDATCQESDLLCPESFKHAASDNVQSGEDSRIIEHDAQKGPCSPSIRSSTSDSAKAITQPIYEEDDKDDMEFAKACNFHNDHNNDKLLADKMDLARHASADSSRVPPCKLDLEMVDVSAANLDVEATEMTEGSSTQPVNNKFLMYTFKRKRKKELVSSPDRDSSLNNGTSQRNIEEKQNGLLPSENPTLISESSRDTRRLAQVARQLISLSEKKWQ